MSAEMKIAKVLAGHRYRVSEFDGAICSCGAIVTASVSNTDIKAAWPKHQASVIVAALGIDELGCGCDEADDNLKAAIKRAEDAEAFGAAAVARAEKAEALVAAVREHVEDDHIWWPNSAQREGLRKILDPKPAFTLPTEAGARFEATAKHPQDTDDVARCTFLSVEGDGGLRFLNEQTFVIWREDSVESAWHDFRLIGADQ